MDPTYTNWVLHGESSTATMKYKGEGNTYTSNQYIDFEMTETYRMYKDQACFQEANATENTYVEREELQNLVRDVETPLYPGCTNYSKMSTTVVLFKHKVTHGLSDSSFNEMLQIFCDMLPPKNTLPDSFYLTKKLLKAFELGYEKIHACINDCCLFRKDLEHANTCLKCGSSRWKVEERTNKIHQGIPAKVLRYFPIIPRLKRMFGITELAKQLRWHQSHKSQDDKMRHLVDSLAWETINRKWPSFALDPRNIRFGLATYGFNPFQDLSTSYSCWPVILSMYNLPLWLCMSKENLMLTLLIPGPKQPGNDIDVYLAPLVEDLNEFWVNGVRMYDAVEKSTFNLKAILMWTINDFPAYANTSGWSTKGKLACPVRRTNTYSEWLPHSRKHVYMGHRRFLPRKHSFRNKCKWFNGHVEEKGKSKDGLNSRLDLIHLDIRKDLHPKKEENFYCLPAASHTLSKEEKELFCKRLADIKLPDGYGSNITNCISVKEHKITGLKSNHCHILIQQLLPVALRGILPEGPRKAILRLCAFFKELCSRVLDRNILEKLEEEVVETLCMLERFFPPSFFDIMVHLTIHLGREARLCGPVQYCWMYPIERYMKILKGYVRNRARPKGCIAERYLAEEYAMFCGTEHLEELKGSDKRFENNEKLLQNKHVETFNVWLHEKIKVMENHINVSNILKWLSRGPRVQSMSYSGFVINGLRFHTKDAEKSRQNNGVSLEATTICRASAKDNAQVIGKVTYYGVLREIIVLDYHTFQLPIFRYDWANIVNCVRDDDGFTLVNLHEGQSQFEKDPFILASQASQVFYSRETNSSNWYVVLKAPSRGFQDLQLYDESDNEPPMSIEVGGLEIQDDNEDAPNKRTDVDDIICDV
ncbi:hypothetical protein WN944_026400 [Citrus x changshan-huyou]|uniref:Transposase n=1 Tax=Citrus x changshan-huyou TaxID=2935761 RepID=A0AAP0LW69_9ROSI